MLPIDTQTFRIEPLRFVQLTAALCELRSTEQRRSGFDGLLACKLTLHRQAIIEQLPRAFVLPLLEQGVA